LTSSLLCLGISRERIIESAAKSIEVERLLIPVTAKATLMPRPEYMAEISRRSREGVGKAAAKPTRRLYISRKAAERSIVNEAELIPVLQKHGFEILQPENLSYEEQVAAFAEAEILMGPHGAGMYNGLFMSPPSMVIEVLNEARWELSAMRMCRLLGIDHWHIHAQNKDFSNWLTYIEPREFERSLASALGFMDWKRTSGQASV
jgi:capsular polysaccharide biosynthesis protein